MDRAISAEIQEAELLLRRFRKHELGELLGAFGCSRFGMKADLLHRCMMLLRNNGSGVEGIVKKIRQISEENFGNTTMKTETDNGKLHNPHTSMCSMPTSQIEESFRASIESHSSQVMPVPRKRRPFPFAISRPVMESVQSLRIVQLPFYDEICNIMELTKLSSTGYITGAKRSSVFSFIIPMNVFESLSVNVEILLRFFRVDYSEEQSDDLPPDCLVRINGDLVALPPVNTSSKTPIKAKRIDRPVIITKDCKNRQSTQMMQIDWCSDNRTWAFLISANFRNTPQSLLERIVANKSQRKPLLTAKKEILEYCFGCKGDNDDDFLQVCSWTLPLICPLSKTRIEAPIRGGDCAHPNCFDLLQFIKVNEVRSTWRCPICNERCRPEDIVIDCYIEEIIGILPPNVDKVEIHDDGSWRTVGDISKKQTHSSTNHCDPIDEVIDLSFGDEDDEDDEADRTRIVSAAVNEPIRNMVEAIAPPHLGSTEYVPPGRFTISVNPRMTCHLELPHGQYTHASHQPLVQQHSSIPNHLVLPQGQYTHTPHQPTVQQQHSSMQRVLRTCVPSCPWRPIGGGFATQTPLYCADVFPYAVSDLCRTGEYVIDPPRTGEYIPESRRSGEHTLQPRRTGEYIPEPRQTEVYRSIGERKFI